MALKSVRYHTYLILQNQDLRDTFAFAYGDTTHVRSKAEALSVRKVGGSREAELDVKESKHESSEENDGKNSELSDIYL